MTADLNRDRRRSRDVTEMLGFVRGILGDGVVNDDEVAMLQAWLSSHPDARSVWPASAIADRLQRVLADAVVDDAERADLLLLFQELTTGGLETLPTEIAARSEIATSLPLDDPAPAIVFQDRRFVLTGTFAMAPRAACQGLIAGAGGQCQETVTRDTDYLVIGTFGSQDWKHSAFGRKIEKAVGQRAKLGKPAIVSEDHWAAALP